MKSPESTGVSIGIRFVEGAEILKSAPPRHEHDPIGHLRSKIDPALAKLMIDSEPRLIAWLRASRENVVAFAMDPITALKKALPDLDPQALDKLAQLRANAMSTASVIPGVRIDRFEVAVGPKGRGDK
jgi:hypothetical protein